MHPPFYRCESALINCPVVRKKTRFVIIEMHRIHYNDSIMKSHRPDSKPVPLSQHLSGGNGNELPLNDCRWSDDRIQKRTQHKHIFVWLIGIGSITENRIYIRQIGFQLNFSISHFFSPCSFLLSLTSPSLFCRCLDLLRVSHIPPVS